MQPELSPRRSIATAMREFFDRAIDQLHTSGPGIVRAYDAASQTARVQVATRIEAVDGTFVDPPVLEGVLVFFQAGGGYSSSFELEDGDMVWLVYAERGIADLAKGSVVSPSPGRHALTNAIAFPMGSPVERTGGRGWEIRKDDGSGELSGGG